MKPVSALLAALAGASAIAALVLNGCAARTTSVGVDPEAPDRFPTVEARNLLDEPVKLPDDLAVAPAMVLVAFEREQQAEVDTWLGRIDEIESAIPGVQVIETPVVQRPWALVAGWLDNAMRSGILETEARRRTVTLFTNTAAFRDAIGLPSDDTSYTLLLDAAGQVLVWNAGAYTDQKMGELLDAARANGLLGTAGDSDRP